MLKYELQKDWHIDSMKQMFRKKQLDGVQKIRFHEMRSSGKKMRKQGEGTKTEYKYFYCTFIQCCKIIII